MAWRRDPTTGEWEMVDAAIPDPMTQSTTQQEADPSLRDTPRTAPPWPAPQVEGFGPTDEGYETGDAGVYPVQSPQMAPGRTDEGLPIYGGSQASPPARGEPSDRAYQNYDYDIIDRWVQEVQARGNEIRKTAAGTFEVEAGTNTIVSQMPSPYPVN